MKTISLTKLEIKYLEALMDRDEAGTQTVRGLNYSQSEKANRGLRKKL